MPANALPEHEVDASPLADLRVLARRPAGEVEVVGPQHRGVKMPSSGSRSSKGMTTKPGYQNRDRQTVVSPPPMAACRREVN